LTVDEIGGKLESRVTAAREAAVAVDTTLFTTAVPLRTFIYVCSKPQPCGTCTIIDICNELGGQ